MTFKTYRLGHLGTFSQSGIDKKSNDDEIPVEIVNYMDVYGNKMGVIRGGDFQEVTAPKGKFPFHLLHRGDILITPSSETSDDIGHSAVVSNDMSQTAYSYHLVRFRPFQATKIIPEFSRFAFQARQVRAHLEKMSKGTTRKILTRNDFRTIPFVLPDLKTQCQIANFLDRETARIDLLIEKKQRLVALLGHKKSASIDAIVNSKEWSEVKLSRLVRMIDGDRSSEYPSDQDFVDEGIPFISSKQIQDHVLTLGEAKFITTEKFAKLGRGKLQDGDIIVTVRGTLGNTAIFRKELARTGFINAQIMIMRPEKRIDPFLLHMFTQSTAWSDQIAVEGYGSAQKQLNQDVLRRFTARYPLNTNPDFWRQIVSDLVAQHLAISSRTSASIDRLKEYRAALITAAVTGQIDVQTYDRSGTATRRLDAIQEKMSA